jgi:hypothetical protein
MSGVIYNNSTLAQCERMSLKSIVALFCYEKLHRLSFRPRQLWQETNHCVSMPC